MNWKTHRRLMIMTVVPSVVLVAAIAFLFAPAEFHGLGVRPNDFFYANPLNAALDLIAAFAIGAYLVYLHAGNVHPRHRSFFMAGALVAGLVADGLYLRLLSNTPDYFNANGALTFIAMAVIFYCIYRLVVLLPLHTRKWLTPSLGVVLFIAGAWQAWHLYMLSAQACEPFGPADLWLQLIGKCP